MNLEGRHALVVGLGKSGAAAAALLRSRGAQVIGADDAQVAFEGEVRKVVPESLEGIDLVVLSPGVPLTLPIFAEILSVMLQVFWFKRTGRRIFRMAPIHHHFELKGWAEPKIIVRFWIVSIILALVALASLKLR